MKPLETADIQGIILRGYGYLQHASYFVLHFAEGCDAKGWLRELLPHITYADRKPQTAAVQVALSLTGFTRLGLAGDDLAGFSLEFRGGMAVPWRSRLLGDQGASAPQAWLWGGPDNPGVAATLLIYARSAEDLARLEQQQQETAARHGVLVCQHLTTVCLHGREHFGFRDGISQPRLRGYREDRGRQQDDAPNNLISASEFVLGYENEYDALPFSPSVEASADALPRHGERADRADLGANGSYMVFRQLEQDVHGFWDFIRDQCGPDSTAPRSAAIALASKMVGRWPSGAPLVLSPDADNENLVRNDFDYGGDPKGHSCPIGSHIRRVNPRGAVRPAPGNATSLRAARRHRLLRRGRPYGDPLLMMPAAPGAPMVSAQEASPRGLHFICFVANIRRQFEFVQQSWMNNPKFNGLVSDPDPVSGQAEAGDCNFTIQGDPVRRRICGVPPFVRVRGGQYLFLPGRHALAWLAR